MSVRNNRDRRRPFLSLARPAQLQWAAPFASVAASTQFAGYDSVNPLSNSDFRMHAIADVAVEDAPSFLPAHGFPALTDDRG